METRTSDNVSSTASTAAGFGPGKALRQARMDLRLSPEDVAMQLHLAPRQIVALENDDYEQLPQSTYVRGYLRSYALLLGLAPEPILESYARIRVEPSAPRIAKLRADEGDKSAHGKVGLYIVGAIVAVLVLSWWQSRDVSEPPPVGMPPQAAPVPSEIAPTPIPGHTPTPTQPPAPSAPRPQAGSATPQQRSTSPSNIPAPAAGAAQTPSVGPSNSSATTPTMAAPAPSDTTSAQPAPTGPQIGLGLEATQESWVEVRDAADRRLVYQTLAAGRKVQLQAVAPVKVFLGNVAGVNVTVNGQAYDATRHQRGDVARFTLRAPAP